MDMQRVKARPSTIKGDELQRLIDTQETADEGMVGGFEGYNPNADNQWDATVAQLGEFKNPNVVDPSEDVLEQALSFKPTQLSMY